MSPTLMAAARVDITPAAEPTLKSLRTELDAIDTELLALIGKRQSVARRIGDLKGATTPGVKVRPDREIEVLRAVCSRAEPQDRRCVESIWREVMSSGLSVQGQVEVVVWSGARKDGPALARGRFGGCADYRDAASAEDALAAAEIGAVAVLSLDADTAWWAELPERDGLWVFDALGRRGPVDPFALVVARIDPSVLARGVSYRVSNGGDSGGDGSSERLISVSQGRRLYAVTDRGQRPLDRALGIIGCAAAI